MSRLFRPGLIAAGLQLATIIAATLVFWIGWPSPEPGEAGIDAALTHSAPALRWIYLITAVGWSLTETPIVRYAASHIAAAANLMPQFEPDDAVKTLLVGCCFTAVASFIVGLRGAPAELTQVITEATLLWPALASIAVAAFGANAHAAARALRDQS